MLQDDLEVKASATIRGLQDGILYVLPKDDFRTIVGRYSKLKNEFKHISSRRDLENRYNRVGR